MLRPQEQCNQEYWPHRESAFVHACFEVHLNDMKYITTLMKVHNRQEMLGETFQLLLFPGESGNFDLYRIRSRRWEKFGMSFNGEQSKKYKADS